MTSYQTPDYGITGVDNRSGQPGGSNAPRTQYSAHKAPPPHVTAARRRQIQIDAMVGEQAVFDPAQHELLHQARRQQAMASAVNGAILTSPSHGGRVGGGMVLSRPANWLPWLLMGVG